MEKQDIRWIQRLDSYSKALALLERAVALARQRELSELEQQGLIQGFEFTHELAWNVLKDFLEERGSAPIYGSKDATREAFRLGIIEDGEVWMRMTVSRNLSSHTYNRDTAGQLVGDILGSYIEQFRKLKVRLEALQKRDATR